MSVGETKRTRAKTATVQPLGLSPDEAAARIAEAFGPQEGLTTLPDAAPPSVAATDKAASSASEPAKAPATESEPPQAAVQPPVPEPKIRPGLYRLDEAGFAEPVSEDDALRYENLNADYTRKQQALAEQRRQFEADQAALKAEREQIAADKARAAALLKQAMPPEPDWDQVYQNDPANAATYYFAYKARQEKAQKAEQEALAAQQKVLQERQQAERARLLELVPQWKDQQVAQREMTDLSHYIVSQGWDQPTVQAILNDSRAVAMARKAMLADKASVAEPETRQKAQIKIDRVKVAAPGGAQQPKAPPSEFDRARSQFLRTGKLKDSVALFDQLLKK